MVDVLVVESRSLRKQRKSYRAKLLQSKYFINVVKREGHASNLVFASWMNL